MIVYRRHMTRYYYVVLALTAMDLFSTTLAAAELSGGLHRTHKLELRRASLKKVQAWEGVHGPAQGTIWISPDAALTNADVAQAQPDRKNDKYSVAILLTEDGALKLARLTKAHIGKFMVIMLDSRVIAVPEITEEIINGQVKLDGNFTEEEADAIAASISVRGNSSGGVKE